MISTNEEIVLSVEHIKKKIGKRWIIDDVTFDIRAGEIFGFLGPNGAGKTTTIRMLVDLIKPTDGVIKVCGYDVNRDPERGLKYVGSIVENPEMYTYLTGFENLEHFARMQPGITKARIEEVVETVRLTERIHDKVSTYSLGMRQRLGIAQALLGRPKLLILDEPTNGLDPKGIKEMRAFIKQLASSGMAVFVSSHLLSEIQLLCDRVAIISGGKVLAVGNVNDLIAESSNYIIWDFTPRQLGLQILASNTEVMIVRNVESVLDDSVIANMNKDAVVVQMPETAVPAAVAELTSAGVSVKSVQKVTPTLEQLFLRMTEGEAIDESHSAY
ncbi:ABC transporter ATP-binding protein [Paenibacillus sediminis]|uniref:ABC-2 type transport system ATP-binding protein n=1 Tax=Paenibacillus sediminis TaxID=664909 RepID=A0ABS4GZZ3_9BACL|nr:ABC transporter ATP-binding protein [Paenibacillus sediminis]MBP1935850.1 ABC-2 type transport system ATP-binding protein [Paenibacillus sediminis]